MLGDQQYEPDPLGLTFEQRMGSNLCAVFSGRPEWFPRRLDPMTVNEGDLSSAPPPRESARAL